MLIRTACVAVIIAFGPAIAFAQDIIAQRQALMKRSGAEARVGAQMARGEVPFDAAKAQAIFATFADKAAKLPTLFPDNSKAGDTRAAPAIWEKPAEFKAEIAKFAADAKKGQETAKDLESFKAAFSATGRDCGSCHETFRKN